MAVTFTGELINRDVKTAYPAEDAASVAQRLRIHDISALLIVDSGDRLEGIVTATDIVAIVADEKDPATSIRDYMTTDAVTAHANLPVQEAAELMVENNIHHLPVVDPKNHVLGLLSATDIAEFVVDAPLNEEEQRY